MREHEQKIMVYHQLVAPKSSQPTQKKKHLPAENWKFFSIVSIESIAFHLLAYPSICIKTMTVHTEFADWNANTRYKWHVAMADAHDCGKVWWKACFVEF